jgi:hypothetical protein
MPEMALISVHKPLSYTSSTSKSCSDWIGVLEDWALLLLVASLAAHMHLVELRA